jgi:hypothetical protein
VPDQLTQDAIGRLHRLQALRCLPNAYKAIILPFLRQFLRSNRQLWRNYSYKRISQDQACFLTTVIDIHRRGWVEGNLQHLLDKLGNHWNVLKLD